MLVVSSASGATQADFRHIYPEGHRHLGGYRVPASTTDARESTAQGCLLAGAWRRSHDLLASEALSQITKRWPRSSSWARPAFARGVTGRDPSGRGTGGGVWTSSEKRDSGPQTLPRTSRLSVNHRAALASRPTLVLPSLLALFPSPALGRVTGGLPATMAG